MDLCGAEVLAALKTDLLNSVRTSREVSNNENRALLVLARLSVKEPAATLEFLQNEYLGESSREKRRYARVSTDSVIRTLGELGEVAHPTLLEVLRRIDDDHVAYHLADAFLHVWLGQDTDPQFIRQCISTLESGSEQHRSDCRRLLETAVEIRNGGPALSTFTDVAPDSTKDVCLSALLEYMKFKDLERHGLRFKDLARDCQVYLRDTCERGLGAGILDRLVEVVEEYESQAEARRNAEMGISTYVRSLVTLIGDARVVTEKQSTFLEALYARSPLPLIARAIAAYGNQELTARVVDGLIAQLEQTPNYRGLNQRGYQPHADAAFLLEAMGDAAQTQRAVPILQRLGEALHDSVESTTFNNAWRAISAKAATQ
jgi:hypothetical protein